MSPARSSCFWIDWLLMVVTVPTTKAGIVLRTSAQVVAFVFRPHPRRLSCCRGDAEAIALPDSDDWRGGEGDVDSNSPLGGRSSIGLEESGEEDSIIG
jgi:hypothetical protein